MNIEKHISLSPFNTFRVQARAQGMARVFSLSDLKQVFADCSRYYKKVFILGGGSNTLFVSDFEGLVIKNEIKGIEMLHENKDTVEIRAYSGEDWNHFVDYCNEKGWWGMENLAGIPGTVGGAIVQNIGAYGAEIKSLVKSVGGWDSRKDLVKTYNHSECYFEYRDSIFKGEKGRDVFILFADFVLSKIPNPRTEYPGVGEIFEENALPDDPKIVSEKIRTIRNTKLPDTKVLGTAGSFFKNPMISAEDYSRLKKTFPDIPGFLDVGGTYKISAGWLIEKVGFKGYRKGDAGVYNKHALILVNYDNACGGDIMSLAERIKKKVWETYNITLEEEVCIV